MPMQRRTLLWLGAAVAGSALLAGGAAWWRHTARPDYLLRRGQEVLRQGRWQEAERLALRLETAGDADRAHLIRGEVALRRRDLARAVAEYNAIRDRDDVLVEASDVYGQWFLRELKRPSEAERFLRYV